jgi:hypothetical protein
MFKIFLKSEKFGTVKLKIIAEIIHIEKGIVK